MNIDFFRSVASARIIFSLGLLNFVTLAALFTTCRCLPTSRIGKNWLKNKRYQKVYKYHCYLWYVLGASVIVHLSLAIAYLGNPF